MSNFQRAAWSSLVVFLAWIFAYRHGDAAEMRFALVIGNDQYKSAKLATPADDAASRRSDAGRDQTCAAATAASCGPGSS